VAVGATSIGGVLVVPALAWTLGVDPARAVAAASFGFAFTGAAALLSSRGFPGSNARDLAGVPSVVGVSWPAVRCIALGALAGACLGAATLAWLPAGALRGAVGMLCVGSGLATLAGLDRGRPIALGWPALGVLGVFVGCVSAWSGTGGPVVLVPLLAILGWPVNAAVDAAQRVQLPVALSATAVNAAAGQLDWRLGTQLGLLVLAGWWLGRLVARRMAMTRLQRLVAVALVIAGIVYLLRG
jgi:uncharacterized membrane protein YfcA